MSGKNVGEIITLQLQQQLSYQISNVIQSDILR